MPNDPFHGRAASAGSPYDNALTITPSDDDDLPVIPSAIMVQAVQPAYAFAEGEGTPTDDPAGEWNRYPYDPMTVASQVSTANFILVEMQNGNRFSIAVPSLYHLHKSRPYLIELRPRRILRTGTTFRTLTLLW